MTSPTGRPGGPAKGRRARRPVAVPTTAIAGCAGLFAFLVVVVGVGRTFFSLGGGLGSKPQRREVPAGSVLMTYSGRSGAPPTEVAIVAAPGLDMGVYDAIATNEVLDGCEMDNPVDKRTVRALVFDADDGAPALAAGFLPDPNSPGGYGLLDPQPDQARQSKSFKCEASWDGPKFRLTH